MKLPPRGAVERGVGLPPVDPDLLRLVDRGDDQPQLDRQQLDVEQVDLDVAGDHDPLVEDAFEDVGEAVAGPLCGKRAHRPTIRSINSASSAAAYSWEIAPVARRASSSASPRSGSSRAASSRSASSASTFVTQRRPLTGASGSSRSP